MLFSIIVVKSFVASFDILNGKFDDKLKLFLDSLLRGNKFKLFKQGLDFVQVVWIDLGTFDFSLNKQQ